MLLLFQAGDQKIRSFQAGCISMTCLCVRVFGAGLAVAALALPGHPLAVPSTVLRGRSRAAPVPLPDSSSTAGVTFRPLCPL